LPLPDCGHKWLDPNMPLTHILKLDWYIHSYSPIVVLLSKVVLKISVFLINLLQENLLYLQMSSVDILNLYVTQVKTEKIVIQKKGSYLLQFSQTVPAIVWMCPPISYVGILIPGQQCWEVRPKKRHLGHPQGWINTDYRRCWVCELDPLLPLLSLLPSVMDWHTKKVLICYSPLHMELPSL
jgi:hypothetical protein